MATIQVRVSEELHAKAKARATEAGFNVSTWLRLLIQQSLTKGSQSVKV